ncbi:MAG: RdgB/HAM1 family non-canonical purine NTP pyrophosphatase [Eubacteriales bacterium]
MTKLLLATHNDHKVREFRALLAGDPVTRARFEVYSLSDIGFHGEIAENGATFEENALIKAQAVAREGYLSVADDSGLEVDVLHGAPGVHSARYADPNRADDAANNALLLARLSDVPAPQRSARFVCAIACVYPDGTFFTVRGSCEGRITRQPQGQGGFGYDPLFYVPALGRTFAQLTGEEKNNISHRGRATAALIAALGQRDKEHLC